MTNEELVMLAQKGCEFATEQLIEKNEGLVRDVAARYLNIGETIDELQSVCRIRLWKCIDKFDLDKHKTFHQYAARAMENELKQLYAKKKRKKRDAILECIDMVRQYGDTENFTLSEIIPDPESVDEQTRIVEENWLCDILGEYLKGVEPLYKGVLEARFVAGYQRQEVADFLGKSREYVRKLELKILDGIRSVITSRERDEKPSVGRYSGELCYVYHEGAIA